jgi:hypothetical protein
MASHWKAVESRKKQEKYRHFRNHRYDVGIVKAQARGPTPLRPLRAARRCEALPERRFTIGCSWAFGVGRGHARRWRNEKPVKLLKTNDLAKRRDFAANDSNDLRPAMRNLSFRQAKDSVRFRRLWASSRPEAQSPSTIPIPAPLPPDRRRFEKLDREKLRKVAANILESLARVNLCAGPMRRSG